jgi:hypothetical protein
MFLLLTSYCVAQNTATISGTIKDSSGTTWIRAYWRANLVGTANPVFKDGTAVIKTVTGSLSSGAISGTLARNDKIAFPNTSWTFTICPFVSSPCQIISGVHVNASSVDVSLQLNPFIVAPAILSNGVPVAGFATSEVAYQKSEPYNNTQPNAGQLFYDAVNDKYVYWSTATQAWKDVGGSSGCVTDCVLTDPLGNQIINQPNTSQFEIVTNTGPTFQQTKNGVFIFNHQTAFQTLSVGTSSCLSCMTWFGGNVTGDGSALFGFQKSGATREFTNLYDDELYFFASYFLLDNCYQGTSFQCDPANINEGGPVYSYNVSVGSTTVTLPSACPGFYNTGTGGDGQNCGPLGTIGNEASWKLFYKVDSSANTVTIVPSTGQTIAGFPSGVVLSQQYQGVELLSNGNNGWYVIGVTNPASLSTTGTKAVCLKDGTNCPASQNRNIQLVTVTTPCTTGSSSYDHCQNAFTWPTAFPDNNYSIFCFGDTSSDPRAQLLDVSNGTKTPTGASVTTVTEGSVAVSYFKIYCQGIE